MNDNILRDLWLSRNPEYLYFGKILSDVICILEDNVYKYIDIKSGYLLFSIDDNEVAVVWEFYCNMKLLFEELNCKKIFNIIKFFITDKSFESCLVSTTDNIKFEFVGIFWIEIYFNNGNNYKKECIKYEEFYDYEYYYSICGSKYKKDSISYIKIINYESKTTEEIKKGKCYL